MPSSDAAFESVIESLEGLRFVLVQFLKRTAYVLDKAILDTKLRPSLVVATTVALMLLLIAAFSLIRQLLSIRFKELFFSWVRALPFTQRLILKEKEKLKAHLNHTKSQFLQKEKPIVRLPAVGWSRDTVLNHLRERSKRDVSVSQRGSKVSGTVYLAGAELENLLCEVYRLFSLTNPLHADVFPSVRQMEAEVITVCGTLMNPSGTAKNICGAMTGGGSESILSAVKASRDYMKDLRNVTEPEMIIAQSAHAAYYKAANYFNIKLVVLKVDKNYQMPAREVRSKITKNTVLVVASAPGFPHGVIDPIKQISEVTDEMGTLLHVDCCLGGFFLPFAQKLGYSVPPFDFSLKGVTSMSVDTHKYGMAHKGTSVVLYRSPALRKFQYTAVTDWTGGMYISPGFAGSRSGALIATAWASLVFMGEQGYLKITEELWNTIEDFKAKLAYVPELRAIANPIGTVVAFTLKKKPERIYQLNDIMSERGWHLSPLQFPPALHMSFTARHVDSVDRLIQDLRASVETMKMNPSTSKSGTAAIYGTACAVPDRGIGFKRLLTCSHISSNALVAEIFGRGIFPSAAMALSTGVRLGAIELKHRVIMSAMTRLRNDPVTEAPRELNVLYYTQRASPGGLLISEGTHPCASGRGYIRAPGIWTEDHIEGWKKVTKAVHDKGGFIFCQLMHTGRVSHPSLLPDDMLPMAPSPVKMEGMVHVNDGKAPYVTPRALELGEIPSVVSSIADAARRAISAGFDGVELHSGNGYLLHQFLAKKTNLREDAYGGSVANRCRFLLEAIDACCSAIGKDCVGVKLQCGVTFSDLVETEEDSLELLRYMGPELSKRQLAYTCLSSLNYDPYYKAIGLSEPNFKKDVWKFFRDHYTGVLMINGGLSASKAEEYVREGIADCVAFGVLFLANANLPSLISQGKALNMGGADTSTWYGRNPDDDPVHYTDWPMVS